MNKVILDTSFIISCVNYKIDFLDGLAELLPGYEAVVPVQVLIELERVSNDKRTKVKDREAVKLGLKLLAGVRKIKLEKKYVDLGIINYIQNHRDDFVATVDAALKNKLRKVVVIRGKRLGLG